LQVIDTRPEGERHLGVHVGHCVHMNEADEAAWDAGGFETVQRVTITGSPSEVRARIDELGERGVTEVVYQPAGSDIRRELQRMIDALR
jgi:5,10-methylenetetrahydromethanopterin reductase